MEDAEEFGEAHSNPANMPCPHCSLAIPRSAHYCQHCGWDVIRGLPHSAPPGQTSSSGRRPATESARRRQALIDSFGTRPGGPTLAEQLDAGDKILAQLEADHDRADRQLREVLATRFKTAGGDDMDQAMRDAQAIAAARAPTPEALDDVRTLGAAYRAWRAASEALAVARTRQAGLLDRFYVGRLSEE